MNSCVPHGVIWGLLAFCIVDFGPCLLVCPGSSVGRALCLDCRVSWVRVPPRAALFSLKKSVVLGAVELFALHLYYLSPHYDSCIEACTFTALCLSVCVFYWNDIIWVYTSLDACCQHPCILTYILMLTCNYLGFYLMNVSWLSGPSLPYTVTV